MNVGYSLPPVTESQYGIGLVVKFGSTPFMPPKEAADPNQNAASPLVKGA